MRQMCERIFLQKGREEDSLRETQRHETCCTPKSPSTSDLKNVRGFRCPCMHTHGHTHTRTHIARCIGASVHRERLYAFVRVS